MAYSYSVQTDRPGIVKAVGISLSISRKQSIEVCNFIRSKELQKSKSILQRVIEMKQAIPYRRFTGDTGHKKKLGPGRYPVRTCQEIKTLLERVEASALQKGLDTKSLVITHISAQKGPQQMHYGRKRRRQMKRTHIEVVAEERKKAEKKTDVSKKPEPKEEKPLKKADEQSKATEKPRPAKESPTQKIETSTTEKPKQETEQIPKEEKVAKPSEPRREPAPKDEPKKEDKTPAK